RVKSYEAIVKGENIPAAEVPESFKVLVKEMKSLCLNVELEGHEHQVIDVTRSYDNEPDVNKDAIDVLMGEAAKTEAEQDGDALASIAAELGELMSGSSTAPDSATNDLIGDGEEA
ncbi:MAG: hypothetical protein RR671_02250, partial [Raoultibacter sp.]